VLRDSTESRLDTTNPLKATQVDVVRFFAARLLSSATAAGDDAVEARKLVAPQPSVPITVPGGPTGVWQFVPYAGQQQQPAQRRSPRGFMQ
jgi:hypothetical protein